MVTHSEAMGFLEYLEGVINSLPVDYEENCNWHLRIAIDKVREYIKERDGMDRFIKRHFDEMITEMEKRK